jgi:hypothetical protein
VERIIAEFYRLEKGKDAGAAMRSEEDYLKG